MKAFIVLATVLACAYAKPGLVSTYNAGFPFQFGAGYPYTAASYYQAAPAINYASTLQYAAAPAQAIQYTAAPAQTIQYAAAPAQTIQYAAAPAQAIQYAAAPAIQYAAPVQAIQYAAAAPSIIAPAFTKTQYHAQTELGEASYGYAHPGQAHSAVRDAFGNVRGSYAYIDPTGKEVRTNYVADAAGFRVEANNLPVAPEHVLPAPAELPVPVGETPEVAQARAEHLQAVEDAKVRNAAADVADAVVEVRAERKKRGISYSTYAAPALSYAAAPAYSYATPAFSYATAYKYAAVPVSYSSSYRYDAPAKTIAYAPAPLKTIAYAQAPLKTISYAQAPLKTFAYAPAALKTYAAPFAAYGSYGYGGYSPALSAYNYGYGYGYSPLAYSNGFSKILY